MYHWKIKKSLHFHKKKKKKTTKILLWKTDYLECITDYFSMLTSVTVSPKQLQQLTQSEHKQLSYTRVGQY